MPVRRLRWLGKYGTFSERNSLKKVAKSNSSTTTSISSSSRKIWLEADLNELVEFTSRTLSTTCYWRNQLGFQDTPRSSSKLPLGEAIKHFFSPPPTPSPHHPPFLLLFLLSPLALYFIFFFFVFSFFSFSSPLRSSQISLSEKKKTGKDEVLREKERGVLSLTYCGPMQKLFSLNLTWIEYSTNRSPQKLQTTFQ